MKQKVISSSFFVILFHLVGFLGFLSPYATLFKLLVPFHLLFMFGLLLWSHGEKNRSFMLVVGLLYVLGFLVELLGVHTGQIFGSYHYGATLGLKVAQIPLLIGLNWVLLIYSAGVAVNYLPTANLTLKAALAAALLVLLDFFIEPVAIRFDYWSWMGNAIPLQNYIAWFGFSFLCLIVFYRASFSKKNPVAMVLLLVQFLFFIGLNYWG